MKIIFLGTNGWYDTPTGDTICILIQAGGHQIILDAGNGLYKADRFLRDDRPVYLFLSHFHLDHIYGLHILAKFRFKETLYICGQSGTNDVLNTLVNFPFTMPLEKLPYKTAVCELPLDESKLPFHVRSLPLLHASYTLGYRFEIEGKTVAYCPDTGYCENAVELARNADLLIAECAYLSGESSPDWPHLNPETAAGIAVEAGASKLALVHFDASRYTTAAHRYSSERAAQKVFTRSFAAFDDMQIEL